jgi:hypothetical protein
MLFPCCKFNLKKSEEIVENPVILYTMNNRVLVKILIFMHHAVSAQINATYLEKLPVGTAKSCALLSWSHLIYRLRIYVKKLKRSTTKLHPIPE